MFQQFWNLYLTNPKLALFLIDASDDFKLRESRSLLQRFIFNHPLMSTIPVLIILNKADLQQVMSLNDFVRFLQIPAISRQPIFVTTASARTGHNLRTIRNWIRRATSIHLGDDSHNTQVIGEGFPLEPIDGVAWVWDNQVTPTEHPEHSMTASDSYAWEESPLPSLVKPLTPFNQKKNDSIVSQILRSHNSFFSTTVADLLGEITINDITNQYEGILKELRQFNQEPYAIYYRFSELSQLSNLTKNPTVDEIKEKIEFIQIFELYKRVAEFLAENQLHPSSTIDRCLLCRKPVDHSSQIPQLDSYCLRHLKAELRSTRLLILLTLMI